MISLKIMDWTDWTCIRRIFLGSLLMSFIGSEKFVSFGNNSFAAS